MALVDFSGIKELIQVRSGKGKDELFKEVLLLILARVIRVDSNIESIEVENVQKAIKELTGDEMSKGDILTAASSEIFETQSLERALGKASRKLDPEDVATILGCLSDLIRADGSIRYQELEFFDRVATAIKASPSEIAGLYEK